MRHRLVVACDLPRNVDDVAEDLKLLGGRGWYLPRDQAALLDEALAANGGHLTITREQGLYRVFAGGVQYRGATLEGALLAAYGKDDGTAL